MALHHRRTQGDVFGHVRSCLLILRERQYSGHRGPSHLCHSRRFRPQVGYSGLLSTAYMQTNAGTRQYGPLPPFGPSTLVLLTEDADPAAGC
jgi:hypothetical protein